MIAPMQVQWRAFGVCSLMAAALLACTFSLGPVPLPSPSSPPRATNLPLATPVVAPSPPRDTGWQQAVPGVEVRQLRLTDQNGVPGFGQSRAPLTLVRLEPKHVRFRVLYAPARPRRVASWAEQAEALLVVNAGFFTEAGRATALVVSDGARWEQTYRGFGGMFAVAGERVWLQSLAEQPYDPAQPLDQAVQSFPMLVKAGGVPGVTDGGDEVAPRTAIAMDRDGRVLMLISPTPMFTLRDLASFLINSDLDVDTALNLDGGTSTGLWLKAGGLTIELDSVASVPAVIAVQPR